MMEDEDQTHCQKLTQWIKDRGAILNKIELKVLRPGHRGVIASAPISKDEEILFVPETAIITLKKISRIAKMSRIGIKMQDPKVKLKMKDQCILAAYLLQETWSKKSYWKVYLEALPKKMGSFPAFFNKQKREEITN
eukprot:TRINITY_DN4716_c0_g1_i2.p1 TRINITY_DN4716_c0_g1~~TRINITY_DN4716_c0_g1_i2.p1  ORF type:complete len:137 (-),score=30.85 TRINITY_DN4716_c0_g1_i2:126-536(-)